MRAGAGREVDSHGQQERQAGAASVRPAMHTRPPAHNLMAKEVTRMTLRQQEILTKIASKRAFYKPYADNDNGLEYLYYWGILQGLDIASDIVINANGPIKSDPLMIPMLELGVHNTRLG